MCSQNLCPQLKFIDVRERVFIDKNIESATGVFVADKANINDAYRSSEKLERVVIPEGVTSIGKRAFCNCINLTSVVIPEGMTSIGGWAFRDCRSLTSVVIPEGVTEIGHRAFKNCSSLTSVVIPRSIKCVCDSAFKECSSLAVVSFAGEEFSVDDFFKKMEELGRLSQ